MNAQVASLLPASLSPASSSPALAGHRPLAGAGPAPTALSAQVAAVPAEVPQLIDKVRTLIKQRHYSARTESAYVEWIHRFFRFFPGRTVASLGEPESRAFLEHVGAHEVPSSVKVARAAVLLLFHGVLGLQFDCRDGLGLAPSESSGLTPLSNSQIDQVIAAIDPACTLIVELLRATDLRPAETVVLRVGDIDLAGRCIHVHDDRGRKPTRVVALPEALVAPVEAHLTTLAARHQSDLAKNAGFASLPDAVRLAEPTARRALAWQWLFPAGQITRDPLSKEGRRRHQEAIVVQRALSTAARAVGITQTVTLQTLRVTPRPTGADKT
jgi:integrase